MTRHKDRLVNLSIDGTGIQTMHMTTNTKKEAYPRGGTVVGDTGYAPFK
jgi:hypothetical protein